MKDSMRWIIHILTGLALLLLLGLHMGAMHLGGLLSFLYQPPPGAETMDWAAVLQRGRDLSTFVMYVVFLLFALFHGLYGTWNVLIEATAKHKIERPLGWIITLVGIALFAYGAYTTYLVFMERTL